MYNPWNVSRGVSSRKRTIARAFDISFFIFSFSIMFLGLMLMVFFAKKAHAQTQQNPPSFNYQGRLLNAAGTSALTGNVDIELQIWDDSGSGCLLYVETHNNYDLGSTGLFNFRVGSVVGDAVRDGDISALSDPGLQMQRIFSNTGQVRAAGADCAAGFTPSATAGRVLKVVTRYPASTGTVATLTPDQYITSVPYSLVAETLQGYQPSDFVKRAGGAANQMLGNLEMNPAGGPYVNTVSNLADPGVGTREAVHQTYADARYAIKGSNNTFTNDIYVNGRIGVGTSSPNADIEVQRAADAVLRIYSTGTAGDRNALEFYADAATDRASIETRDNNSTLLFNTGGTQALSLNNSQATFAGGLITNGSIAASGTIQPGAYTAGGTEAALITALGGLPTANRQGVMWYETNTDKLKFWSEGTGAKTLATEDYVASSSVASVTAGTGLNNTGTVGNNIVLNTTFGYGASQSLQGDSTFGDDVSRTATVGTVGLQVNKLQGRTLDFTGLTNGDVLSVDGSGNFVRNDLSSKLSRDGSLAMTGTLTTRAGTAAASTAPIKIQAGVNGPGGVAEAGSIYFDGSNISYVNSAGAVQTLSVGGAGTYLPLAGGTMTGAISMGGAGGPYKITNLADGTAAADAVNYGQITAIMSTNDTNFLRKDGSVGLTADWDANGATAGGTIKITGLADATVNDGAATKGQLDSAISGLNIGNYVLRDGSSTLTSTWDIDGAGAGTGTIRGLATPTNDDDAARKKYVDDAITGLGIGNYVSRAGTSTMTGDWNFSDGAANRKITNLANPTAPQDAATKNYVDTNFALSTSLGNYVLRDGTSAMTGGLQFATWTTPTRPAAPVAGQTGFNTTTGYLETWTGAAWVDYSAGGASSVSGTGTNKLAIFTAASTIADSPFGVDGSNNLDLGTKKLVNVVDPTAAQDAATKNYVDTNFTNNTNLASGYVKRDGTSTMSADWNFSDGANNRKITNLADPTAAQDAATKNYIDTNFTNNTNLASGYVKRDGSSSLTSDWDLNAGTAGGTIKITGLADATSSDGAATFGQMNTAISTAGANYLLKDGSVGLTANWNADGIAGAGKPEITGLADPTGADSAATKNYVDTNFTSNTTFANALLKDGSVQMDNNSGLKFGKFANDAARPGTFVEGQTAYNQTRKTLEIYDGAAWQTLSTSATAGETNTASNLGGVGTEGLFNSKVGVDLQFKSLDEASNKITVASTASTVTIDVNEANLSLANIGGIVPLAKGGTEKNLTAVNGGIVYSDADSMEILAAGTAGYALTSNGAAAPSWTDLSSIYVKRDGTTGMTADWNIDSIAGAGMPKITNLADGTAASDAATFGQMNSAISTAAANYVLKDGTSQMTGGLKIGTWATAGRPTGGALVTGVTGFNTDTGFLETYTGSGWVDYSNGAGASAITSIDGSTGTTLTVTDDTNVTVTGGAGNLALGWSGQLALSRGGTNKNMTATNGGIVWTDADSMEVSAAGTSGQILRSNGAAAPTWVDASTLETDPSTLKTLNAIPKGNGTTQVASNLTDSGTLVTSAVPVQINNVAAVGGTISLREGTGGGNTQVTGFRAPADLGATDSIYTMPAAYPAASGYALTADTSGNLSWTNIASGVGDLTEVQVGTGLSVTNGTGPIPTVSLGTELAALNAALSSNGFIKRTGAATYSIVSSIDLATDVGATVLPLANGGTSKALTAANGGIIYSDADSMEVLAAGTAGYALTSNGAAAPTWTDLSSIYVKRDGSTGMTADWNIDSVAGAGMPKITNLADGSAANDAATFGQMNAAISTAGANYLLKDGTVGLTANWNADGIAGAGKPEITGLADPTGADSAATKNYVDTKLITKTLPAAPAAGQDGQSLRWNNGGNTWEFYTPSSGTGDLTEVQVGTGLSVTNGTGPIPTVSLGTELAGLNAALTANGFIKRTGAGTYTTSTSVALGSEVSGVLPLANGGSNKNMTAVNGGIVWTDADSMEVSAAGTSGQILRSNGGAAPTWVDISTLEHALVTNNVIPKGNGTTQVASSLTDDGTTLTTTLPVVSKPASLGAGNGGSIRLEEGNAAGNNYVAFRAPDSLAANNVYVLPSAFPAASGYALTSTTTGTLSWTAVATGSSVSEVANSNMMAGLWSQANLNLTGAGAYENIAFGPYTGNGITTGDYNSSFGFSANNGVTTGSSNTAFGYKALFGDYASNPLTGSQNTAVGAGALTALITTGNNNTALGYNAGSNLTTGSNNILIGSGITATAATTSNQLNIGNTIYGDVNTKNVSIGTSTVTNARFEVADTSTTTSAILVPRAATMTSGQVDGMIRYNTDNSKFEFREAGSWKNIGGGSGTVTGTGTTGKLTKWSNGAGGVLADSIFSESGTVATVGGSIQVASGTNANPSISFTSDADTGFYSSSDGIVGITINGVGGVNYSHMANTAAGNIIAMGAGNSTFPSFGRSGYSTGMFFPTNNSISFSLDQTPSGPLTALTITSAGNIDMLTHKVTNLADGTAASDAAAFGQIGAAVTAAGANYLRKDGTVGLTANWNADGIAGAGKPEITGLADPTGADSAATKNYADTKLATKDIISAPGAGQNGQALIWNNANNRWEYSAAAGATDINGLSDAITNYVEGRMFLGSDSGTNVTTSSNSTSLGLRSLRQLTSGAANTAIGYGAGANITTAASNTVVGADALNDNVTGFGNTAVGANAAQKVLSGNNVAIGDSALLGAAGSTASYNVALGKSAGSAVTTAAGNILIGAMAGDNVTSGANNIIIGYNIDAPSATGTGQMSIGNLIYATGIDGTGTTVSGGRVAIGHATPLARLDTRIYNTTYPAGYFLNEHNESTSLVVETASGGVTLTNPIFQVLKGGTNQFNVRNDGNIFVNSSVYGASCTKLYTNASGQVLCGTDAGSSIAWGSVTSKPATWLDDAMLTSTLTDLNTMSPSGFYQGNNATNSPTAGVWYNVINSRHNNSGNAHGFQIANSYGSEDVYTRSYSGALPGTFTTWRKLWHAGNLTNPASGTGTTNYHAKWSNGTGGLTNSIVSDDGTTATVAGALSVTGAGINNSSGYQIVQTNATDWLRINQNNSFTNGTAAYGNWAFGTGGVSIGAWSTGMDAGSLRVLGAGQATTSMTTANTLGGSIIVGDTGGAANNGGAIVFSAAGDAWRFAAIKGGVTNGGGNTSGYLSFSTRRTTGDATLTEALRINEDGTLKSNRSIATASGTDTDGAIDFNNGNAISTSYNCLDSANEIQFTNLRDGGTYTLVVTGTGTAKCQFNTATLGADAATVSYKFQSANAGRLASKHTVYTLMRVGTNVYVSWAPGFN